MSLRKRPRYKIVTRFTTIEIVLMAVGLIATAIIAYYFNG